MSTKPNLYKEINCIVNHWQNISEMKNNYKLDEKRRSILKRLSNDFEGMDEHIIPLDQLCSRLKTDIVKGLGPNQARHQLSINGPNIVTTNAQMGEWRRFLKNLFDWFNGFLWMGALLCFITFITEYNSGNEEEYLFDNLYLGCALVGVVLISGVFSYYQEAKSADIFVTFRDLIPRYATVVRAGSKLTCLATEVVVGDLIEVRAGDRVAADFRVISSTGFKCVNPLLTGNSEPFSRSKECLHINPFETNNLVFFSTNCIQGSAQGIVIRTGDHTLVSHLLDNLYNENKHKNPSKNFCILSKDVKKFFHKITYISLFIALSLSGMSYMAGYSWLNAIIFLIALFVAQIPEGLYPTITVVLTLAAKRMTAKNCLIKNLETVETLGLTSTIITNKTGTLTQEQMIVSHIWANNSITDSDNFYRHSDGKKADLDSLAWRAIIRCGCLCNRAKFSAAQTHLSPLKRETIGDSTETAILRYMEIVVGCVETYRLNYPQVYEIPFDPDLRYSLSINKFRTGYWLCMKGAPEVIFDKCSTILTADKLKQFDDKFKTYFMNIIEDLGDFGERIVAFCDKYLPYDEYPLDHPFNEELQNYPIKDLRFIGLISLQNPPRPSVPDAVYKCRSAGIKIIMITGDHPITAKAIARAVGIIAEHNQTAEEIANRVGIDLQFVDKNLSKASVLTGDQIEAMDDNDLHELLNSDKDLVFARTSSQQKSKIIRCCRTEDSVITMSGDKGQHLEVMENADIKVGMGVSGSDMSKQSADIILLDDNFATIVVGIEEGRVIFDNLKKSICYTLSSKPSEIFPFLLYLILDIPLALGAITILCIDLITDMIPAISLAYEFPEHDIMKQKPRDPIVNRLVNQKLLCLSYCQFGVIQLLSGFFSYVVIMSENGFLIKQLLGIRHQWDSSAVNDLMDSYGQEWTYKERKTLEYTCHTAFFAAIVITKWSALICCKTRRISILRQKMKNDVLNFSLFFELGLALFLSYCPSLDKGINMYPLKTFWWFTSIPFAIYMLFIDELRRFLMRSSPKGWLENETHY